MNWKQLLMNLAGAALAGGGAVAGTAPAGSATSWKTIGAGAAVSVLASLVALFQTPPHQNAA